MNTVTRELLALHDAKHQDFLAKLIPNIPKETILGIKIPLLRKMARSYQYTADAQKFLNTLPHSYLEENLLHVLLLKTTRDIDEAIHQVEQFLPYIDNWAVCDIGWPKVFRKHPERILKHIHTWLESKHPYILRYTVGVLLSQFLEAHFHPEMLELVAKISHEDYYVQMMQAWYFATALTKQYEATIPLIESKTLTPWVHNKTIQKARESRQIDEKTKAYLKTLKI